MFHFPALPPAALCIQAGATAHHGRRVSPFGNPRITAWLPAPRGISQAPASFLGSWCQGIHRVPLKTWHIRKHYKKYAEEPPAPQGRQAPGIRCSRPLCSSQDTDSPAAATPHPRDAATACNRRPGQQPAPSGPNSVPTPAAPALPRSGPPQGNVLTGKQETAEMNNQRPTRKQWTRTGTLALPRAGCSLERR
jgi:hypothetical protein